MNFELHVMQDANGNKWVVDGLVSEVGVALSEDAEWQMGLFKLLTGFTETEDRISPDTEMIFFLAQIGPFSAGLISGPLFDEKIAAETN